jgi:hypothetical protein
MRRINYMRRAARRFLQGTRYRTPADAVEAGVKSLTEWVDTLNLEREKDWLEQQRREVALYSRSSRRIRVS